VTGAEAAIDQHIERNLDAGIASLSALCAIPSVSSGRDDLRMCANAVGTLFARRGFSVQTFEGKGRPPIVYAEVGTGPRTILCYNHYDVQPPEPVDLWTTPPFAPSVRNGALFARGAIDDKGELVSRLMAIDAFRAADPTRALRIKVVVEGAEEIGSPGLHDFVIEHADALAADACIWEAGGVDAFDRPLIGLGVRGLLYVELRVRTMSRDAHSGDAHALPNAVWRLLWAVASLKDSNERVAIPEFYDSVQEPSGTVRAMLERIPSPAAAWRAELGVRTFAGGRSDESLPAAVFSPTANLCGFSAGYDGPGMKTVIPSHATCKMDFRLVPDQDPRDIARRLRDHLDRSGYDDVEMDVLDVTDPSVTDADAPIVSIAAAAARGAWGTEPVVVPMVGGSGPMASFSRVLGIPIVSVGCSYPGARKHAPDEHVRIADLANGAKHVARIFAACSSEESR
jgi:acetylornithine deacetylase/succinyl-diaminopimelate desuccinylase-like protein